MFEAGMDRGDDLPQVLGAPARQPSYAHLAPKAAFLSQLIAERDHLAPQRLRRRATPQVALSAYRSGGVISVRRMPAGYRTTRVV